MSTPEQRTYYHEKEMARRRANGVKPRPPKRSPVEAAKEYYETKKANDPDHVRKVSRKTSCRRAGITVEQYDEMFESQGGTCAICRTRPDERSLAIDHCHETDTVRGLLCMSCNIALGKFQDDPQLMFRAAHYIRKHANEA